MEILQMNTSKWTRWTENRFIPFLQYRSYSATDWPTVKLLHDLQVFFSNPSMGFKAGNSYCQIILKGLNKLHCPLLNFPKYLSNQL